MTIPDPAAGNPWLSDSEPLEEDESARQIQGVIHLLSPAPRRIADFGCGAGRLLVPLAARGHFLTGIDHRAEALAQCRVRLEDAKLEATLVRLDFLDLSSSGAGASLPGAPFDAVLCTGNTIMTIVDIDVMLDLLRQVKRQLAPDGLFIIDDCCASFWPLVTEGSWQSGLDDAGDLQLVWHPSDTIFALRQHDEVDADCWEITPGDRCFRLWTDGQLQLAARAAGLSAPSRIEEVNLLVLRPVNAR